MWKHLIVVMISQQQVGSPIFESLQSAITYWFFSRTQMPNLYSQVKGDAGKGLAQLFAATTDLWTTESGAGLPYISFTIHCQTPDWQLVSNYLELLPWAITEDSSRKVKILYYFPCLLFQSPTLKTFVRYKQHESSRSFLNNATRHFSTVNWTQ